MAFEIKSGKQLGNISAILEFQKTFPHVPLFIVSLTDTRPRILNNGLKVIPYSEALALLFAE